MKILWIYHNKIGLVLEVISIHFRDFLKVNVQDGDIILGSPKLQIFFGVWLIFPIYFGGKTVDAGSKPTYEEKHEST